MTLPEESKTPAPAAAPPLAAGAGNDGASVPARGVPAAPGALLRNGFPGRGSRAAGQSSAMPPSTGDWPAPEAPAGTDCGPLSAGPASSRVGDGATGAPCAPPQGAPGQAPASGGRAVSSLAGQGLSGEEGRKAWKAAESAKAKGQRSRRGKWPRSGSQPYRPGMARREPGSGGDAA